MEYVKQNLNVCVRHDTEEADPKNCSVCSKCLRTLIVLEAMGLLGEYSEVFDLNAYKDVSWRYKCELVAKYGKDRFATENVDFARARGLALPSYAEAIMMLRVFSIRSQMRTKVGRVIRKVLGERGFNAVKKLIG